MLGVSSFPEPVDHVPLGHHVSKSCPGVVDLDHPPPPPNHCVCAACNDIDTLLVSFPVFSSHAADHLDFIGIINSGILSSSPHRESIDALFTIVLAGRPVVHTTT